MELTREYTPEDLEDYYMAEDIMRETKGIVEAFRALGFEGWKDGYEIGHEIYQEAETVIERNGRIDEYRLQELGAEVFRENGWPSPRDAQHFYSIP